MDKKESEKELTIEIIKNEFAAVETVKSILMGLLILRCVVSDDSLLTDPV